MIRNLLFITFLTAFFVTSVLRGQIREQGKMFDLVNLERHQFKFNLFGPGLSYELGLFKGVSASTSFGLGIASYQEGYTFGFAWHTRLRYYYNFKRRIDMRKNVSGNS
ncbi:MAG: hypothetical protein ABJN95_18515 [Maribacter sp.]|uniref:hypothetical protein n=1 Tax=Maribacter sp. TaxID=1897614 RepID=UPI003298F9CF